jgi:hypothetical protein
VVRRLDWGRVGSIRGWLAPGGAGSTRPRGVNTEHVGIDHAQGMGIGRAGAERGKWSRAHFGSVGGRLAGLVDESMGPSPYVMHIIYIYRAPLFIT